MKPLSTLASVPVLVIILAVYAAPAGAQENPPPIYRVQTLVTDQSQADLLTDVRMVNPVGLAFDPTGPFYVTNHGQGSCTMYNPEGTFFPSAEFPGMVVVPHPVRGQQSTRSRPTGIVFNDTQDFVIRTGGRFGPARCIMATDHGSIVAWSPDVDATRALQVADYSEADAVYKGLAIARRGRDSYLYATNFRDATVDIFNRNFRLVAAGGTFVPRDLPREAAPFGIHRIGDDLFVTYASRNRGGRDVVRGEGNGAVLVFRTDGTFLHRFAMGTPLNAPYAVVQAPDDFGYYSGALLVGNHGDGRIYAFDPDSGVLLDALRDPDGRPIQIDGLWSLTARRVAITEPPGSDPREVPMLYFTAGTGGGRHGIFGRIRVGPPPDPIAQTIAMTRPAGTLEGEPSGPPATQPSGTATRPAGTPPGS